MEDLLNEDDFLQKPKYNPWPRFLLFYGIEVLAFIAIILLMMLADINVGTLAIITMVFLPLLLAPIMILSNKKYTQISDRQAVWGMLILFLIYLTPFTYSLLVETLASGIETGNVIILSILLIIDAICILCVIAVLREERRRAVKSHENKMKAELNP